VKASYSAWVQTQYLVHWVTLAATGFLLLFLVLTCVNLLSVLFRALYHNSVSCLASACQLVVSGQRLAGAVFGHHPNLAPVAPAEARPVRASPRWAHLVRASRDQVVAHARLCLIERLHKRRERLDRVLAHSKWARAYQRAEVAAGGWRPVGFRWWDGDRRTRWWWSGPLGITTEYVPVGPGGPDADPFFDWPNDLEGLALVERPHYPTQRGHIAGGFESQWIQGPLGSPYRTGFVAYDARNRGWWSSWT